MRLSWMADPSGPQCRAWKILEYNARTIPVQALRCAAPVDMLPQMQAETNQYRVALPRAGLKGWDSDSALGKELVTSGSVGLGR